jgi:hypothetical protein
MDLSAYLLNGVVEATAPPNETAAAARSRGDAIFEMVRAFDPRDALETMLACHCVMLQFLLHAAMRDASNSHLEPAVLAKTRAGAISVSRTLHQWVTKFEKVRKRNEARAAEPARSEPAQVAAKSQTLPGAEATPVRQSVPIPADRPAAQAPRTNGPAPPVVASLVVPLAAPTAVSPPDAKRSAVAGGAAAQDRALAMAGSDRR